MGNRPLSLHCLHDRCPMRANCFWSLDYIANVLPDFATKCSIRGEGLPWTGPAAINLIS